MAPLAEVPSLVSCPIAFAVAVAFLLLLFLLLLLLLSSFSRPLSSGGVASCFVISEGRW